MKKLLFTAVSALALVGVATAADSTQFGVLAVDSPTTRTIVSIPWCDSTNVVNAAIKVKDIILTANLTENDTLHVVNTNGVFANWELQTDSGVLRWKSVKTVTGNNEATVSASEDEATLKRGDALMLIRQNPTNDQGVAKSFYVMGQLGTSGDVEGTTIGAANTTNYYLIAYPGTTAWSPNNSNTVAFETDKSYVGDEIYYYLNNSYKRTLYWAGDSTEFGAVKETTKIANGDFTNPGWYVEQNVEIEIGDKWRVVKSLVFDGADIPVGIGAWYVSKSGKSRTITWKNVQVNNVQK